MSNQLPELEPCVTCGTVQTFENFGRHHIYCPQCGITGAHSTSKEEAYAGWNQMQRDIKRGQELRLAETLNSTGKAA